MNLFRTIALLGLASPTVLAFDYQITGSESIVLTDVETGIDKIATIFTDEQILVSVDGLTWEPSTTNVTESNNLLVWETFLDGQLQPQASGTQSLADTGRILPTRIDAGEIVVGSGGRVNIRVEITVDGNTITTEKEFEAYGSGVSIIPLLVVLVFALSTRMVEFSLFSGIFIGACMISGNLKDGFKSTLEDYILEALADVDHGYVYLFTLFLSGLVGMLEKSGGMYGFTKDVSRFATTPRTGQLACFSVGIFVFFDDYANVLLAGETMRPLLDLLYVSREKLSFIVDATSAPIASLSPVSSWVGFEVGLIQTQLDIIVERAGTDDIGIKTSGLGVFLQSIKYRYYPIFMIVLMLGLIYSGRDFGPMLVAERKTQVYERSDGGDGKGVASKNGTSEKHNAPKEGTPLKSWNMVFPVLVLIFFIFYMLVKTGEEPGTSQSFMDKIENSNSYSALLWGTMAAVMLTTIFYLLQPVKDGKVLVPVPSVVKELFFSRKEKDEDAESPPRFLMTVHDSVESFLYGMGRIFPALIVLTLAWASGAIMIGVGADRLFSRWIVGGIDPKALPTLSFIISMFMALATGTSWGTMSILFPLILVPTYDASNGDPTIFYAVTAGVLSGSVAGDHMSPISDTTVLSALACDCDLIAHVTTQVPYAMLVVLTSIILGTVPIGYDAWPNIIGILLGAILLIGFVYGLCAPVVNATGRFDPVTELFIKFSSRGEKESSLLLLKEDTIKKAAGENVQESKDLDVSEDDSSKKLEEAVYETPIGVEAGDSREENENM